MHASLGLFLSFTAAAVLDRETTYDQSSQGSLLQMNRRVKHVEFDPRYRYVKPSRAGGRMGHVYDALYLISDKYDLYFRNPCAVVAANISKIGQSYDSYVVRLIEMLQLRGFRIQLAVRKGDEPISVATLTREAAVKGILIVGKDLRITRVSQMDTKSLAKFCTTISLLVSIEAVPSPTMLNIATHGIFIPLIDSVAVDKSLTAESKRLWLSYDQIWLPSWGLQAEYSRYIMSFIEFAMQGNEQSIWPVINSVVVAPNATENKPFIIRSQSMLKRGKLESRLRKNFHRIRNLSSQIPSPRNTPSRYAAVIYEGRIHYALEGISNNVMSAVRPEGEWDLHIFHSEGSQRFVTNLFGHTVGVFLHKVANSEQSINMYNSLLTGEKFWETLQAYKRVLIFQVDSFFVQPLMTAHLEYDYIGAPWCLKFNKPARTQYKAGKIAATDMISVGNGGLSIRNPKSMLRCIREYMPKHSIGSDYPEDLFYIQCLTEMKMSIAPPVAAAEFAVEQLCNKADREKIHMLNTTALHAVWYSVRESEFDKLIR